MADYPADFGELSYREDNKERFLAATKKLLDRVALELRAAGLVETTQISVNRAGIAVGGDVYGYFYAPGLRHGLLITITHSCLATRRRDGVVCYGQYRAPQAQGTQPNLARIVGDNQYLAVPISPAAVSALVRRMLAEHPEAAIA